MKQLLIISLFFFRANQAYSQDEIYRAQASRVYYFMELLEKNKPEEFLVLIDESFVKSRKNYLDSLKSYSKELAVYLPTTNLSVVGVFPEKGFNTFRCRYGNFSGDYFYIDLYLTAADPWSQIIKLVKRPASVLKKDRKKLAEHQAYQKKHGVPEPPPQPPPGVIFQQNK